MNEDGIKPSDRIRQIQAQIAQRNTEEERRYLMNRGIPEFALTVKVKADDPALLPAAIIQYLDEQATTQVYGGMPKLNWRKKLWLEFRFWLFKRWKCRICGFSQSSPAYFAGEWAADDLCLECAVFVAVYMEPTRPLESNRLSENSNG